MRNKLTCSSCLGTFFINQSDCGELCISFDPYSFFEINNFLNLYVVIFERQNLQK